MAARHFAHKGDVSWEEGDQPQPVAVAFGGKHFKEGSAEELTPLFVPTVPLESFVVPVSEDAQADSAAKSHVDRIMAELEEQIRAEAEAKRLAEERARAEAEAKRLAEERARAEAQAEARRLEEERLRAQAEAKRLEEERLRAEVEARRLAEEETERVRAEEAHKLAESEGELAEEKAAPLTSNAIEAEEEAFSAKSEDEPEVVADAVPAAETLGSPSLASSFWSDDSPFDLSEPLDVEPLFEDDESLDVVGKNAGTGKYGDSQKATDERENGLEATLVLDRVVSALDAQVPDFHEEHLSHEIPRERLEVSTNPVQMADASVVAEPPVALARREPQRPLGFFAAIGAFFARLFHLDDR